MGNQESSRRVTFENDVPERAVKISQEVVAELLKQSEAADLGCPHVCRPTNPSVVPAIRASENPGPPELQYVAGDKEDEVKKTTEYWEDRIKDLEETHKRINEKWDAEYKRALEDVDSMFGSNPQEKKICEEEKKAVLSCYQKNADKTLECIKEVQAFYDCVDSGGKSQSDDKEKKK